MKNSLALFAVFCFSFGFGQDHYLKNYQGLYRGTMKMNYPGIQLDSLIFEMKIQKIDELRYNNTTRFYYKGDTIMKAYELVLDTSRLDGFHYVLDEKDGILIYEALNENCLISSYTVTEMLYTSRTCYTNEYIDYELVVYDQKSVKTTKNIPAKDEGEVIDEDQVFEIQTFPLVTTQFGRLYKQD